ncbi:hypothetical protein MTY66_19030 [Mycolicibacterium sp. TY66]|nr:hypothetical protein MTY66_19030 [Mycolicibacterium sp. TY66]
MVVTITKQNLNVGVRQAGNDERELGCQKSTPKLTFERNYSWAEASAALKVALGRITAEVFSGSG